MRRGVAAAVFAVATMFALPAFADARAEVEKSRASYVSKSYADAETRLRALLDDSKSGVKEAGLLSQARMLLGAALIAQNKAEAGDAVFETLVLEDQTFDPDPLSYQPAAINRFIDIRSSMRDRIRLAVENNARLDAEQRAKREALARAQEQWLNTVKQQAQDDKTTVRNSRVVACLPFGVGQFQNGENVLGWIFLGTESALTVATAITLPMYAYARNREQEELASGDVERKASVYHERAENIRYTNLAFVGGLALVAAAGIVQANATFVTERVEHKKRELPVAPSISLLPGGGYFGASGTF